MDNLTPEQRRKNMQAIKNNDTKSECILRKNYGQWDTDIEKTIKSLLIN